MADIKLFRIDDARAFEVAVEKPPLEKHVQELFERHLEVLIGVRLLVTQYDTGRKHRGRIDSLGIDENSAPVIVEYKLHQNENVMNQGLFYLDWLLDHRAEFESLAKSRLATDEVVDWASPRVLCIAEDFSRYDIFAVEQIAKSIELIRFRMYPGQVLLELVNQPASLPTKPRRDPSDHQGPQVLNPVADVLQARIMALGDDIQFKPLKLYVAFRRLKNFACLITQKRQVLLYLRLDPDAIELQSEFSKDVRGVGHWGTGDVELKLSSIEDVDRAMPLVKRSYEGS